MNDTRQYIKTLVNNNLSLYSTMGNIAMKNGDVEGSFKWFQKGLSRARELNDKEKVVEFSSAMMTLL